MKYSVFKVFAFGCLFLLVYSTISCNKKDDTFSNHRPFKNILILGNSITRHPPAPEIMWNNDWGMAASALDKDYVHLLERKFKSLDNNAEINFDNIYEFEAGFWQYDYSNLKRYKKLNADLIILRIGDNVNASEAKLYDFKTHYVKLIDFLTEDSPSVKVLSVSSFLVNPIVDIIIQQVSENKNMPFVSLSSLSDNPLNTAIGSFENPDVAAHPSDQGMAAIADHIWTAVLSIEN